MPFCPYSKRIHPTLNTSKLICRSILHIFTIRSPASFLKLQFPCTAERGNLQSRCTSFFPYSLISLKSVWWECFMAVGHSWLLSLRSDSSAPGWPRYTCPHLSWQSRLSHSCSLSLSLLYFSLPKSISNLYSVTCTICSVTHLLGVLVSNSKGSSISSPHSLLLCLSL